MVGPEPAASQATPFEIAELQRHPAELHMRNTSKARCSAFTPSATWAQCGPPTYQYSNPFENISSPKNAERIN